MTLSQAAMGSPARIVGFRGLPDEERSRLEALGLREEVVVTKLLRTPLRDPLECLAGTQLVALEAWLLDRILVSP